MDHLAVKAVVFEMGIASAEGRDDVPVLQMHVVPLGMSVFNQRATIDHVFSDDRAVALLRDVLNEYLKVRAAKSNQEEVGMKVEKWSPQPASDQTLEDLTLREWIGQAVGSASMCWEDLTKCGSFDTAYAAKIADALEAHVQSVIDAVIKAERVHSVKQATVRDLLQGLKAHSEERASAQFEPYRPAYERIIDTVDELQGSLPTNVLDYLELE